MTQSRLARCKGGSWNLSQTAMLCRLLHPVLHVPAVLERKYNIPARKGHHEEIIKARETFPKEIRGELNQLIHCKSLESTKKHQHKETK
jgi:hypothetical protein